MVWETRAERCHTKRGRLRVCNSAMQWMARTNCTGMVQDVRTATELFLPA